MEKLELLKPNLFMPDLHVRLQELKKSSKVVNDFLLKAPEGSVYARKSNGVVQYFNKAGKYLPKNEIALVKSLAKKKYYKLCQDKLKNQIMELEKLESVLSKSDIEDVYESLPDLIKPLVEPLTLPDDDYVMLWKSVEYAGNANHEIEGGFYTSENIHVRSKSEVIIADVLHRMNIPFRYEYPVELHRVVGGGTYTAFPDFYCLNVRTREEYVWEHFGLMDDSDYVEKMVRKIADFQKSGWLYGKNLIFTLETAQYQLNTRSVELLVREFLK